MPFMKRLQSAMILKTPMFHPNEAHITEHLHAPFYEAIKQGDGDAIKAMIRRGFDIDFHEAVFTPPLIFAVLHRQNAIVSLLLENGAHVNSVTTHGESALHVALRLRQYDTATLLLRYGANADMSNSEGMTPRQCAEGDTLALEILDTTAKMPFEGLSPYEYAKNGDLYGLSLTCNKTRDFFKTSPQGHTLVHLAIYGGNLKMIIYLLNKGLNIDATDNGSNTPLNIAVKFAHYREIVQLLIERKATLDHRNALGRTPLTAALNNGYDDIAMVLLKNGANIHVVDGLDTPLTLTHDAIAKYPERAQAFRTIETELLIRGAHLEIPVNHLKWTPIFFTVSKVQDHAIKEHLKNLIHLGADLNYRDTNGRTPLMIAASLGRYQAIETLVNNYANVNLLDNYGWSALMLGVYYNHYKSVEFLLEVGANVNLASSGSLNALKIAKDHKRSKMISLLLEFGATEEENSE